MLILSKFGTLICMVLPLICNHESESGPRCITVQINHNLQILNNGHGANAELELKSIGSELVDSSLKIMTNQHFYFAQIVLIKTFDIGLNMYFPLLTHPNVLSDAEFPYQVSSF